jgi:hypothetical protein
MANTITTVEPIKLRAGDTVKWKKEFNDYPSSEWTLEYIIYNSNNYYKINATAQPDNSFLIEITSAQSATFAEGEYKWIARVKKGEEVYTVGSGTLSILPNITSAVDDRSHVKKVLDALERAMEGRAERTDLEYWIGDKRIRHMTHEEIYMAWRRYKMLYEQELQAEKLGKAIGRNVKVRFV